MRYIELLAPARDKPTALEAISHGADAVYIGAERFGARAAAGNPAEGIGEVCRRAHAFRAKVYVTLNTILKDDELDDARRLAWDLYDAGADALIVQDMAWLEMELPPIALHASTQMNNRTARQVGWLRSLGFRQVVLARELTLGEMADIHRAVPGVRLEAFVHGSICVSYNGQCYASQHCFRRSANRGECAQFCRLPFDLVDGEGRVVERQRHLLSLRDMNRSAHVERMLDAGITSLKIEGRLKDVAYVKNVVAHYRRLIDAIIARRPQDFRRASLGWHTYTFSPRPEAAFNRGFTDYFLTGRARGMASTLSPKSIGERAGEVMSVGRRHITVRGHTVFANGDGLCFYDQGGHLHGFRVNRAEGDRLFPHEMPPEGLCMGTPLFRNYNRRLEATLSRPSAERRMPVRWHLGETRAGFRLRASVSDDICAGLEFAYPHEAAHTAQRGQMRATLSRLGGTPFVCDAVDIELGGNWFVPASVLTSWRNEVVGMLLEACRAPRPEERAEMRPAPAPFVGKPVTYLANVANRLAERFYLRHGATRVDRAMEVQPSSAGDKPLLMQSRYCILHELGHCTKDSMRSPLPQPLYLRLADGRKFRLAFDCAECRMKVYAG